MITEAVIKSKKNMIKRIVDVCMTVILLCLMAYQVTGEELHEWIGMGMTLTVFVHNILNRKWYAAIFTGKYQPIRIVMTIVNIILIASFLLTAFCGMSMSGYAVPFLYGMAPVSFVRRMHLSMSHWSFVLMGIHLGLHIKTVFAKVKVSEKASIILQMILTLIAGCGFWLSIKNRMTDYLFFRVPFAMLDYEKAAGIVLLENILMLIFWVFVGMQIMNLLIRNANNEKANLLFPIVLIMAAMIIGFILNFAVGAKADISAILFSWRW